MPLLHPIDEIIESGVQEIQALDAFIRHGEQHTQSVLTDAAARVQKLEAEIAEVRRLMELQINTLFRSDAKGRLLGGHAIGPHASTLLGEITLAMKQGVTLSAMSSVMHAYPTYPEALKQLGDAYMRTRFKGVAQWVARRLVRFLRCARRSRQERMNVPASSAQSSNH